MGKLINEVGNTYGYLTVIERAPNNKDNRAMWRCKCKCGNEVIVMGKHLRSGNTRSCGCLHKDVAQLRSYDSNKDMIGKIYGYLQVIDFADQDKNGNRKMKCKCTLCNNITKVRASDLKLNNQTSCGCINSKGNSLINLLLTEKNINFKKEYRLPTCKDERPLPFDFAFFDIDDELIGLLEYQGIQHFTCENHGWDNPDKFKLVKKHDKIKFDFCKENNIKLYYITYKDNIEEKLKEILDELYS